MRGNGGMKGCFHFPFPTCECFGNVEKKKNERKNQNASIKKKKFTLLVWLLRRVKIY